MVTEDATEHAHLVLNQVVEGGFTYAVPILLISAWLFVQGAPPWRDGVGDVRSKCTVAQPVHLPGRV